jgi:hypothetical protein
MMMGEHAMVEWLLVCFEGLYPWALTLPLATLRLAAVAALVLGLACFAFCQRFILSFKRRHRVGLAPLTRAHLLSHRNVAFFSCLSMFAAQLFSWGLYAFGPKVWSDPLWPHHGWLACSWLCVAASGFCAYATLEARDHDQPWSEGFSERATEIEALRLSTQCDDEAQTLDGQCLAEKPGVRKRL